MPEVSALTNLRIIGAVENYQPRLSRWFRNGLSGKQVVLIGDSTTALAVSLFSRLTTFHIADGQGLDGVADTDIVNQGNNGATLASYLAGSTTYKLADLYTADPDLVILCYGINDVRLGLTSENALVALLEQAVDQIRRHLPNSDILLAIPNSFLTTDVGGNGYVSGITAQQATDRLWNAYKRMENRWPNVVVFDKQQLIHGRTCLSTSDYMADQIHPSANGQNAYANALVAAIGVLEPFNAGLAAIARAASDSAPWSTYAREVEDPDYYDLIATGEYLNQGSGFVDFTWPSGFKDQIAVNDLVQMGTYTPFLIPQGSGTSVNGSYTRILGMGASLPNRAMSYGTVNVWRPKYGDTNLRTYLKQTVNYPYRRIGRVVTGGSGFIDVTAHVAEDRLAKFWHPTASDILLVVGQSPLTLSGATFTTNGNNLRILKSGDYSAYDDNNPRCAIVGAHLYESGSALEVAS